MSFTDTLTERFETAGRTAVENVTEANTTVVDTVVEWNQKAVDATVKFADRVEAPFAVPFADQLPTAEEAGKRYMELVNRAADANRDAQTRVVEFLPAGYQPTKAAKKAAKKTAAK